MRLFTALWVPPVAAAALASVLDGVLTPDGWRAADPATWHVTLAFHGDAAPGPLVDRLESAVRRLEAPRLRLAGAGAFDGVRWAGLEPGEALTPLVSAVGGDERRFVPHVTLLRGPRPDTGPGPAPSVVGHRGPWWWPAEVLLVASEPGRGAAHYRPVHGVAFGGALARR